MPSIWASLPGQAGEICARFPARGQTPASAHEPARGYFERLWREERLEPAVEFLAHALPMRTAAWWGCLCLWDALRPAPPPGVDPALSAVYDWIVEPTEERRRAAERAANQLGDDGPAGYLAQAVFLSGGSLIAPELPVVPPPPFLGNRLVAGAVRAAAMQGKLARGEQLQRFLHLGADIADGSLHWSPV